MASLLAAAVLALPAGACFTGAGAEGLSCERDEDCGLLLSCDSQTGCCGGPCLDSGGGDTQTSTSTTATSMTTTSTTSTTTTTTDTTTSTTIDPGSGSSGEPARCGDGDVDAEADEECDLGDELNGRAYSGCTEDCRLFAFLYSPTSEAPELPDPAFDPNQNFVDDTLFPNPKNTPGWNLLPDGQWGSGPQPPPDAAPFYPHGVKRLVSAPFRIPDDGGTVVMNHQLNFNVCSGMHFDGGRVYLVDLDMMMRFQIAPEPGGPSPETYIAPIDDDASGCGINEAESPWASDGLNAFVASGTLSQDEYGIGAELHAKMVRFEIEVAFDCSYCGPAMETPPPNNWVIQALAVVPVPPA